VSHAGHLERDVRAATALRQLILGAISLLLVQILIGMVVNLYVTIPAHHAGTHASNFLSGSIHSVVWALGHEAVALAIHTAFGLALGVMSIGVAVRALRIRQRAPSICCVLAGLLIIGAGFNGASFLDYNLNANSLAMAVLTVGALLCYVIGMYLLPSSV
jgi:hypothetical protein